MESFSTRGLPAMRKLAYWNELNSEAFAVMEIMPRNIAAFDGELRREWISPLTLMEVRSDAVRIRHTRSHVARVTAPSYLLLTPLRGDFQMHVERRPTLRVATGEFCLLDHAMPYELQHGDAVHVLCLDIPRNALDALLPNPGAVVGRIMHAEAGLSRILAVLLREIGGELEPNSSARFAPALAQGLLGFVAAAYTDDADGTPPAAAARRQALLGCIDVRLNDPELRPADIARSAGISTRRLRALLAAGGESFSSYVLRRRLERCAGLLRDARWRRCSITDIAFRMGFNSATHFGYVFKQRYGRTPSDYRTTE